MKNASLHYLTYDFEPATRLATQMNIPAYNIQLHTFPDEESKVRITPVQGTAILYISLNNPDEKLIQIAFAASALKQNGASRIVLVTPYLCYMRQDKAFHPGEAISQHIIGLFLSSYFDKIITVDPHLHRVKDLQEIFPECEAESLTATEPISNMINNEINRGKRLLVGPDSESKQWVSSIAEKTNIPFIIGEKTRRGDRDVIIEFPDYSEINGAHAIIVDDVISSGKTIIRCAEALKSAGATKIEAIATHMLCNDEDLLLMRKTGISIVRSTDSVQHSTNSIHLTTILANALQQEI